MAGRGSLRARDGGQRGARVRSGSGRRMIFRHWRWQGARGAPNGPNGHHLFCSRLSTAVMKATLSTAVMKATLSSIVLAFERGEEIHVQP